MFVEIKIRNLAVLKDLSISFEAGLNVVTGETGAGKSIVVDALEVLLGGRASSDMVRSGEPRALVEALVDIRGLREVAKLVAEVGLEADNGHLVLRREVRAEGRSRGWVNGSPVSAAVLRRIGSLLVDIHGQHEHQRLLSADFQQAVLDAFGGCREMAAEVRTSFRRITSLRDRLAAHESRRLELEARADFIRFQLDEILGARVRPGEDEGLRTEANRLANADLLAREGHALHRLLHGGEKAATDHLADAAARLRRLSETDPSLAPLLSTLEDAYHQVSDAANELANYAAGIDHDPARLESLRERQSQIERLQRKYGPTLADVIGKGEALRRELDELETADLDAAAIARELARSEEAWGTASAELSRTRREAADRLSSDAAAAFPGLGLEGARFDLRFEDLGRPAARGRARIRFPSALNPGFPSAPLSRIASGRELSRVLLVLTSVPARLVDMAPPLLVEKDTADGTAVTVLRRLDGGERVREIARMLGGDPDSESSLDHARELLGG